MTDGARTRDNQNHNLGLYQLSYGHRRAQIIAKHCQAVVRLKGIEPLTHGLEGRCSIQLSYRRLPVRPHSSNALPI